MTFIRSAAAVIILTASVMTGCATAPDPAKICTAEWIQPRTDRALDRIESRTKAAIKPLQKAAKSYAQGKEPGMFQLMALSSSFKKLERELKSGQGVKDLKTVAQTCNKPELVSDALLGYMQKQGLPSGMIGFIQSLPMYQDLITVAPNTNRS